MKKFIGFEKGVNLGGWFSQCDHSQERYDDFITEEDFKTLSSWGIDHVRLPVDYNLVETEDGSLIEKGFERIRGAIGLCRKYGFNMILDLHKTRGYSFDNGYGEKGFFESMELRENFYRLWREFAKRFGKDKDMLAFELLNEVTDREYGEAWNRISAKAIECIRESCPDIPILLGGYWNNSPEALPDLDPPADENIVYNFHCYAPLLFTHQGAGWIETMPKDFRIAFSAGMEEYKRANDAIFPHIPFDYDAVPDGKFGAEYFERLFEPAVRLCEERGCALYCGEYGVIDRAELSCTLEWYKAIHAAFEKYGISRAAWSYKEMDFGLSDDRMSPIIGDVVNLL